MISCMADYGLHLIYGDANDAVAKADFAADAWFLDGFTPAKNPQLWNQDLLMAIGRLTRAGGSFATFTVASAVRQRLAEAGFEFEKRPGFGRKRDMLVGRKRAGALAPQPSRAKSGNRNHWRWHRWGFGGGGVCCAGHNPAYH